jgi:outer membrane protein TolC
MAQELLCEAHVMGCRRRFVFLSGAVGLAVAVATGLARADLPPTSDAPASIDSPQPSQSFTMAQALAYAHAHQPAIREALARVSARLEDAKIPTAQWFPTVGVTAQLFAMTANNTTATFAQPPYMDLPRIGATSSTTAGSFSPYASTLVGVGLTQEVFDFGRIEAERAAADAEVEVERHRSDTERLDIDFGVEEAYFSVSASKAIVRASEEAYERSRVHRDLAKRGVDAGLRSPIELTRAEADLARFDVGRIKARGGEAVAQSVLSAAIGAPDGAVDISPETLQRQDMPALPEAIALARQRDPRLAETITQLKAAEAHTGAVGAELRPDFTLTGTFSGRAGGAPPSSGPTANGDGWVPNVPNWDAGIVFSWPLFDGTIYARRNAAHSAEDVRRSDIDVVSEQDLAAVRQAYVEVRVANAALVALDDSVVAARANYDQANARFDAGIGNAVELADAEAVRTNAEIQLALGQFEAGRARAAFGRAIAEGL